MKKKLITGSLELMGLGVYIRFEDTGWSVPYPGNSHHTHPLIAGSLNDTFTEINSACKGKKF